MYTRWRLYILAVFLIITAAALLGIHLLRKRGVMISRLQAALFVVGLLLTVETLIILQLSNFNLGVVLPAFFGVPLMLLAFLLPHLTVGFGLFFKRFVFSMYGLAGLIFLVCGICMLSVQRDEKSVSADAVIVLGAAVHGDRVTWVLENRLNTAMDFLFDHPGSIAVVSGGQGPGESVTEASAMKKYMVERGIPEDRIYMEEQATNTPENFRYSKEIIDGVLGPEAKIAFVTTDFHVFRAGGTAKKQGIDAVGIAAPDVWYLKLNNFMRESVGICVYLLRGQI